MIRTSMAIVPIIAVALATCGLHPARADAEESTSLSKLATMSLEDLTEIEITSVSKRAEKRSSAAAAIHVITEEDIRRSAATSLPDLLRMAPGIHVASLDASTRSVSSRGFGGRYASSLLVLVDGRSIYTPLFSGVEWEISDRMLENIERIEIIRGPGGALWGANAVNGVINIITKSAADTQGGLLSLGGGTEYPGFGALSYGGPAGADGHYRLHLRYLGRDDGASDQGRRSDDDADNVRGGARFDWDWGDSQFTLIGDLYAAQTSQVFDVPSLTLPLTATRREESYFSGGSLLGRWMHTLDSGGNLRIQAYYDRAEVNNFLINEDRGTADLEMQYQMPATGRHELTWGMGFRYYDDRTEGSPHVSFHPADQRKRLFSAFLQDRISFLDDKLVLTLGTKLEHNDFTGVEIQPSARLAWTPNDRHTLWAAVSRAVRTPSLGEESANSVGFALPGVILSFAGSEGAESEQLLAFEAGYRVAVTSALHVDLALFYNRYDDLHTQELGAPFVSFSPLPPHFSVPAYPRNNMEGRTYGAELAVDWRPTPWWRVRMNYSLLEMDLTVNPDTLDLVADAIEDSSPQQQVFLGSYMDLGPSTDLDVTLRYVDELPGLGIENYLTMDIRAAWRPSDDVEIEVVAHDLLEPSHKEYDSMFVNTVPTRVQRGVYGKVTWRF